ncbi:MAG TPA: condensation domain-containing protein, partial [Blastocatellia bacterium]
LINAILGVLKARAVFAIMDCSHPDRRVIDCLDVARPSAWIDLREAGPLSSTLTEFVGGLPLRCKIELDGLGVTGPARKIEPPDQSIGADDPAYVAFTSGTTGKPKAVLGTHRPLSHFIQWYQSEFGVHSADRFSMLSGLSHDPLLRDIVVPLSAGAAVCVPPAEIIQRPDALVRWLRESEVTITHITPSLARLIDAGIETGKGLGICESLRQVLFGGAQLVRQDVDCIHALAPRAKIGNFYGATETPQAASYYDVKFEAFDGDPRLAGSPVPIGKGIEDVQLLVLNEIGGLAGIGEPGEVYVRTPYLSAGYLNDETLTRERFPALLGADNESARAYRTGDMGRYRSTGDVQLSGRRDSQVKIRGFRVELEEVEIALRGMPGVKDCAATVVEVSTGESALAVYLVAADSCPRDPELNTYLRGRLPEYMIPAVYVRVERFPLTANGKIDRGALPPVDMDRRQAGRDESAPKGDLEETISEVWAELLGLHEVPTKDNFFDLGGHSILAVRVVSRLNGLFGIEMSLGTLFSCGTVEELAARIRVELDLLTNSRSAPKPIVAVDRNRPMPLSFAQRRLWFMDQMDSGSAAYNLWAVTEMSGMLAVAALDQVTGEVVRRHEVLRTSFSCVNEEPVQEFSAYRGWSIPLVDLNDILGPELEKMRKAVAREIAGRGFDLSSGPLLRTVLLRIGPGQHALYFAAHHIVFDGWSTGIFSREIGEIYKELVQGSPSRLDELTLQYADFAVWQREWLQGARLSTELEYWKGQFGEEPPMLKLPTDRIRPAIQTYSGAKESMKLSRELSMDVAELSRGADTTIFMTLLAAFGVLLARLSSQEDLTIGVPVANRSRNEVEELIGFFVNTLPLRLDFSGDPTFTELLERVREVAVGAFQHQELPFERLVEELRFRRHPGYSPLFQVMFHFQNAPAG